MTTTRAAILLAALALPAAFAGGCESTQSRSAELGKNGDKLLETEDISITQQSADVRVLSSTLLVGEETSTVAVEVENKSQTGLINVPIQIDVRDERGKSLFRNDAAGTDPTLVGVPVIGPGETVWWVHDQVFAPTGTPATVKVEVGDAPESFPEIPKVSVTQPKLASASVSGLAEATGEVENKSGEDLRAVYVYAVAMKGAKVVAAGRGAIDKLRADAKKPDEYHIFFTAGDPSGADIQVSATPTFLKE